MAEPRDGGVTARVIFLCLGLAAIFGYIVPIINIRFTNTYLGAAHLPPGTMCGFAGDFAGAQSAGGFGGREARVRARSGAGRGAGARSTLRRRVLAVGHEQPFVLALGALAILFLLAFGLGRRPLSRNESLTMYISCLFFVSVPGHGSENFFVTNVVGPFYFANAENKWLGFSARFARLVHARAQRRKLHSRHARLQRVTRLV